MAWAPSGFDAQAVFDTTEDNISGFLDVMALSMLTGQAWPALCRTTTGFGPLPARAVVLAAVRDLVPYQQRRLAASELQVSTGWRGREQLVAVLDRLRQQVKPVYPHVDLDALDAGYARATLDAGYARANQYAPPGGPSLGELIEFVRHVFERFEVVRAALTAYDPTLDTDARALNAACSLVTAIAAEVAQSR